MEPPLALHSAGAARRFPDGTGTESTEILAVRDIGSIGPQAGVTMGVAMILAGGTRLWGEPRGRSLAPADEYGIFGFGDAIVQVCFCSPSASEWSLLFTPRN